LDDPSCVFLFIDFLPSSEKEIESTKMVSFFSLRAGGCFLLSGRSIGKFLLLFFDRLSRTGLSSHEDSFSLFSGNVDLKSEWSFLFFF